MHKITNTIPKSSKQPPKRPPQNSRSTCKSVVKSRRSARQTRRHRIRTTRRRISPTRTLTKSRLLPRFPFVFGHFTLWSWVPFVGKFFRFELGSWRSWRFMIHWHFNVHAPFGRFDHRFFRNRDFPWFWLSRQDYAKLVTKVVLEVDQTGVGVHVFSTWFRVSRLDLFPVI